MELFKIGELYDGKTTKYREGCKFNITNSGATLELFFTNPSTEEIKNCRKGPLTFNFIKLDSIIFFIVKINSLALIDCPYSVHLSKNLTKIAYPSINQGLALTLFLINANTGILECMRLITLGEKFSKQLIDTIKEQGNEMFDIQKYNMELAKIYQKYNAKQLEKMSRNYYKTKEE